MKKKFVWILLGAIVLSMTACGKNTSTSGSGTEVADAVANGVNPYGEVELCDYKGLEAEKAIYEITDADVDDEIETMLAESETKVPLDRGIENGDGVIFYFTAKVDGEVVYDYSDDLYDMFVGEEELGEGFDKALIGSKKGDTLNFSLDYDETYWDEDFQGKTVEFDVTIDSVYQVVTPELTDQYITDTLGYSSEEDMRSQIKNQLQEQYDYSADAQVQHDLLKTVIDNSNVTTYNQELYDSYAAAVQAEYESDMELLGLSSIEDTYESLGVTAADVEEEILYYVYEAIVVHQIAINENISISEKEYQEGLKKYADQADEYDSVEAYEEDMGEDNIRFWLLEDRVALFLEEHADITAVEGTVSNEDDENEISLDLDNTEIIELDEDNTSVEEE